jgi:hypothetical protein
MDVEAAEAAEAEPWCEWNDDPVQLELLPRLLPSMGYYVFYASGAVVHMRKVAGKATRVDPQGPHCGIKKLPVLPATALKTQHVCTVYKDDGGCRTFMGLTGSKRLVCRKCSLAKGKAADGAREGGASQSSAGDAGGGSQNGAGSNVASSSKQGELPSACPLCAPCVLRLPSTCPPCPPCTPCPPRALCVPSTCPPCPPRALRVPSACPLCSMCALSMCALFALRTRPPHTPSAHALRTRPPLRPPCALRCALQASMSSACTPCAP